MKTLFSSFIVSIILGITAQSQESISDVHTITSDFERVEIIRMRPGTDLLDGLNTAVKKNKINRGFYFSPCCYMLLPQG